ncbi:diguanylate cyclase [Thalassolituus sp.]|jgi:diguanylate cyclase (GGDEF)-like protein|uniref:sensor domain-containing diguanylate cyclase n=1 Tax=Thalassolituus sp. TaxID=2030822 RepID=UPI002A805474|nr:diguanylate cyclase [Thalassolituus sp.]
MLQSQPILVDALESDYSLSLEQAIFMPANEWLPMDPCCINLGFHKGEYWFRVNLEQITLQQDSTSWMLEIDSPLLDYVQLFHLRERQVIFEANIGNALPFNDRLVDVPNLVVPLRDLRASDQVYIRVSSSSALEVPLHLFHTDEFWQARVDRVAIASAFYAIMLAMIIYNALIFLLTRDTLFLLYSSSLLSFSFLIASIYGWTYKILWPNHPVFNEHFLMISIVATCITSTAFSIRFLRLHEEAPSINRLIVLLNWVALLSGFVSLFAPYEVMIRFLTGLGIIMSSLGIGSGILLAIQHRSKDYLLYLLSIFLLLNGFILFALQKFAVLDINKYTVHAVEFGVIFQVLILAISLAERHNRERIARMQAQEKIISLQREANDVLDKKVKERTEDLEQLNSKLQEETITDALTRVRNRRYFDQRFFSLYHDAFRQHTSLALLLMDIDHFKKFNDIHGHHVGDLVLQQVAQAMQDTLKRPSDTVYRSGGEEFAILLPSTDMSGALQVAETVRSAIANLSLHHQNAELSVTISIGVCADVPHIRNHQDFMYQRADKALYAAKAAGRNCIRSMTLFDPDDGIS